ncbi:hypothetical protein ACFL3G_06515 [Planctomycetota bacterium]
MNTDNNENLNELFDIQEAERILRDNPAPEPGAELIANIKAAIDQSLDSRKTNTFRRTVYKVAAVAAIFFATLLINVKVLNERKIVPDEVVSVAAASWESDEEVILLAAEIEQFEADLTALQLGENGDYEYQEIIELETELIDIDNDFWKG